MIEQRPHSAAFGLLVRELIAEGNGFRFCARGRSMWPTIQDGDILHVEPIRKAPRPGDIVLFFREGEFKAHRIIGGADNKFVTRGDAGMEIDGVVRREEMIGKVVAREFPPTGQLARFNARRERARLFARRMCRRAELVLRRIRWQVLGCVFAALLAAVVAPFELWATQAGVAVDQDAVGESALNCSKTCSGSFSLQSIAVNSGLPIPC